MTLKLQMDGRKAEVNNEQKDGRKAENYSNNAQ